MGCAISESKEHTLPVFPRSLFHRAFLFPLSSRRNIAGSHGPLPLIAFARYCPGSEYHVRINAYLNTHLYARTVQDRAMYVVCYKLVVSARPAHSCSFLNEIMLIPRIPASLFSLRGAARFPPDGKRFAALADEFHRERFTSLGGEKCASNDRDGLIVPPNLLAKL